jgi:hypothetical protein
MTQGPNGPRSGDCDYWAAGGEDFSAALALPEPVAAREGKAGPSRAS